MSHLFLAETAPTFWLPRGASTVSGPVDNLFNWIMWICIFFFVLITVLLVLFAVVYRHRPGVKRDVGACHSNTLELTWTLIPSLIVVVLYYYGFRQYMNISIEPPNSYEVTATGQMWQWSFTYPNHTDTELHVPLNVPIRVVLESKDVIHDLYIPDFRVKKDVVPGRYNHLWFQATDSNYSVYAASLNVNGKPLEIAVDSNGQAVGQDAEARTPRLEEVPFSKLAAAAQAAMTSQPSGTGEVLLTTDGNPVSGAVNFGTLPSNVQGAMKHVAGTNIPDTQPVYVLADADPYDIYCAAYCGTNHSIMRSRVIVHRDQADFNRWLAEAIASDNTGPPEERGKKLHTRLGCAQCHSLDGSRIIGPSWKDLWGKTEDLEGGTTVKVDRGYVAESITQPLAKIVKGYPGVMPPFPLKDQDIDAIIAYMKTISSHTSASELAPTSAPATAPVVAAATNPAGPQEVRALHLCNGMTFYWAGPGTATAK